MTETKIQTPCDCAETAHRMGHDLEWFCWMFGCDVCADAEINCGRPVVTQSNADSAADIQGRAAAAGTWTRRNTPTWPSPMTKREARRMFRGSWRGVKREN